MFKSFADGGVFEDESPFFDIFKKQVIKYRARAPFSALGGEGDVFQDSFQWVTSARSTMLHLDVESFPIIPPSRGESEGLEAANSYALDFMMHGRLKYLAEDNGLTLTQAWKAIHDFGTSLDMLCIAIEKMCPHEEDLVRKSVEAVRSEMKVREQSEGAK